MAKMSRGMKVQRMARWALAMLMVLVWLLAVALGLMLSGCGWPGGGDGGTDYVATQAAREDLTATVGAEVFEAVLTAVAKEEGK